MASPLTRRRVLQGLVGGVTLGVDILSGTNPAGALTGADVAEDLPRARTFYVSAGGSDDAAGTSPNSAWATIQKVNAALPENSTVLFRCGDTFYGELSAPINCEVGSYGSGSMPVLTLNKILNHPYAWVEHDAGIWKIDLASPETHDGYTATTNANIGHLTVDGKVRPSLKFDLSELRTLWDFYCDIPHHTLYVAAPVNPTTIASNIMAAPNGDIAGASGAVVYCQHGGNNIHDVHITGSGGCGIRGNGSNVRVHHCLIDYIGGSLLAGHGDGRSRYGNGIENWSNVSSWLIETNEIAHVYDAAWSAQGFDPGGGPVSWADITVTNNYFHDSSQMLELWSESKNPSSRGFVNIRFENNRCERAGYGVFANVRPNQAIRVHLLTYRLETPVDVTIENNVFDDSYGAYSYHAFEPPASFATRNNTIRLQPTHLMQYQRRETVEEAAIWQAATGRETGSVITAKSV